MYQALYRKCRPKTFDDVVGQPHISETLKRQVISERLSHAYLFIGTRGTGKTSCAKILAKAVNCRQPENGNPCNKCASCIGIDNGSILDVLELDAASNNGVDNVRALREEAVFTPVDVKKRVYIIDEVHMLSTSAFNALLKILEEPPEHLIFILATTEIHKIPATILSRCQRHMFKRILAPNIATHLMEVAGREDICLTPDAAALLARLSDGSLRDALSLLDQCAAEDEVDTDSVLSAIGLAGNSRIVRLLDAVASKDIPDALRQLDSLYTGGKVISAVLEELLSLIRDVLITRLLIPDGIGLLSGGFDQTALDDFAERFTPEQLMFMLDILRESIQDMVKGSAGKLDAELCLIRLSDARLNINVSALAARVSLLEQNTGTISGSITSVCDAPMNTASFAESPPKTLPSRAEHTPAKPEPKQKTPSPTPTPAPSPIPSPAPTAEQQPPKEHAVPDDPWKAIVQAVESKIDISAYTFLGDPAQVTADFDDKTLTVKTKSAFAAQIINSPDVTAALKDAAMNLLQKPMAVRVVESGATASHQDDKLDALRRYPNISFE